MSDMDYSPTQNGKRIEIAPSVAPCAGGPVYVHWKFPSGPTTGDVFGGLLMHELQHSFGFHHASTCQYFLPPCYDNPGGLSVCGLMDGHGENSESYDIEYSDWQALRTKYGYWENDGEFRRESPDTSIWITMGANAVNSGPIWTSAWPIASSYIPVYVTDPTTVHPHLYKWNYTSQVFYDEAWPITGPQFGAIAVALGASSYFTWYVSTQTADVSEKHLCYTRYTSSHPASFQGSACDTQNFHQRQGVGGAYDQKSGRLVHVIRGESNNAYVSTSVVGGQPSGFVAEFPEQVAFTPSIACGASTIDYNCIAVFAGAAEDGSGEDYHFLKWRHFRIVNGLLDFESTTHTQGYVMYAPPSVVYRGPDSSGNAFVVGFYYPGTGTASNIVYTATKSATGTYWSNVHGHSVAYDKHLGPPLLGATPTEIVEAWMKYNQED
ncbi:MAG: hypothetical protein H6806_10950 [Planctomycetes bacterium]|nr:hypothetical protein [Planctomycetota bacterium]